MSYITASEFTVITGQDAPEDFPELADMASAAIDAATMYGFTGRDISSLPVSVRDALRRCTAYQTHALSVEGGISGACELSGGTLSIGKFSIGRGSSGSANGISPAADALLPFLIAYVRGN